MDKEYTYNLAPKDGAYGALTLIHELGHALGLKHPFSKPSAGTGGIAEGPYLSTAEDKTQWTQMSYEDSSAQYHLEYSPLDIAALQYLYGVNPTARAGNDVYKFSQSQSNFIWDGAGTDAIDASLLSSGATIYLTPGYWGFVGASKASTITSAGQITVNFGTVIENLVGSAYADRLYGNEVSNQISGGAGNDQLYGGAGNDVFDWDADSRGGADTMYGGTGDDTYVIDSLSDVVVELLGEGTDTIWSGITYSIANVANVENLLLFGTQSVNATGNALANVLRGNDAVNVLTGGGGNDTLIGGAGADTMLGDAGNNVFLIALAADHATGEVITGGADTDVIRFTSAAGATLILSASVDVEEVRITDAAGSATGTTSESINATSAIGAIALYGNSGANTLTGNASANYVSGGGGNDTLIGGAGIDTTVFNGAKLNSSITKTSGTIQVLGPASDGNDTLTGVERLKFTDVTLAFDLDGHAGNVAKLLGVLLGKNNWNNQKYIGIGLDQLDNAKLSFEQLMDFALNEVLGVNASNGAVVNMLYTNLVGTSPSLTEYNEYVGLLNNGTYTQTSLAIAAANHEVNATNIGLVGLFESGLQYLPVV